MSFKRARDSRSSELNDCTHARDYSMGNPLFVVPRRSNCVIAEDENGLGPVVPNEVTAPWYKDLTVSKWACYLKLPLISYTSCLLNSTRTGKQVMGLWDDLIGGRNDLASLCSSREEICHINSYIRWSKQANV